MPGDERQGKSPTELVSDALRASAEVKLALADLHASLIAQMAKTIVDALRAGGKVLFLGNGGSAADAQHLAAELIGRFRRERAAIPALALSTNSLILTAIANDYSYDQVFARQVEALVSDRDVVVGISTSGHSPSVLLALQAARQKGARCLGLTGRQGQPLAQLCDLCLLVPSDITAYVQEAHIAVGHALCGVIEDQFVRDATDRVAQQCGR